MAFSDPDAGVRKRKKSANVLCGIKILCTIVLMSLPLAKVVMGAVYLHQCGLEPLLPVLQLVSGLACLALVPVVLCLTWDDQDSAPSPGARSRGQLASALLLLLLLLFLVCWAITNAVYVFRARAYVGQRPCNSSDGTVAAFAFDPTTPVPTSAPLPTSIPLPTSTPFPTSAPVPTSTPLLTPSTTPSTSTAPGTSSTVAAIISTAAGVTSPQTASSPGAPCLHCNATFWTFCYVMAVLDLLALGSALVTSVVAACVSLGTACLAILLCRDR